MTANSSPSAASRTATWTSADWRATPRAHVRSSASEWRRDVRSRRSTIGCNVFPVRKRLLTGAVIFTVIFPLLLFPWARSIWLGFDQWNDPRDL